MPRASAEAAVATAAHLILVDQFDRLTAYGYQSQQAMLDAAYAASLAGDPNAKPKCRESPSAAAPGPGFWRSVRTTAGTNRHCSIKLVSSGHVARRVPVRTGHQFWISSGLGRTADVRSVPPGSIPARPPLSRRRKKYAEDFNEIKNLGGDEVTTLSARTSRKSDRLYSGSRFSLRLESHRSIAAAGRGLGPVGNGQTAGILNLAWRTAISRIWIRSVITTDGG